MDCQKHTTWLTNAFAFVPRRIAYCLLWPQSLLVLKVNQLAASSRVARGKKEKEENCKKKTAHVFTCVGKQLQISHKQLENESRSVSVCFCEKQCEGGPLTAMCDVKLNCFVLRLKSLNICFVKCTLTYLNDLLRNRWFAICELSI